MRRGTYVRTSEIREKNRKALLGRTYEDTMGKERARIAKEKLGRIHKGRRLTAAHREALLASNVGRPKSPQHREAISRSRRGKTLSKETREAISRGHMGQIPWNKGGQHSLESIEKMRESQRKHNALNLPSCSCWVHGPKSPTGLELLLIGCVLSGFPEVISQKQFGCYRVDAYLPEPYHLAFEADGEYWHRNSEKRDAARDAFLLRKFGLPIIRISEEDFAPFKEVLSLL